jgi:hypothetical protein
MSRAPPTSKNGKNTSGQEVFGSKIQETLVVESPEISMADVASTTSGAGRTAASEADKAGTSAPPATKGEGGDLCTSGPLPTPDPQAAGEGVRGRRTTYTGACTSAPHGRRRSSPIAAMWRISRRRHT